MAPRRTKHGKESDAQLDPVEVYCRVRPINIDESEKCLKVKDEVTVGVAPCNGKPGSVMEYKFSKVFGETVSQKYVFDCVGSPLIEDLVRGKNGLLFTYGITSSGKTHTMTGTGDDQGILPRCLDMVFNTIQKVQAIKYVFRPDKQNGFNIYSEADAMLERQQREVLPNSRGGKSTKAPNHDFSARQRDPSCVLDIDEDAYYSVFVSFVEIYNSCIFDLLEDLPYDPITGNKPPQSKILREDMQRTMFVHNVTEVEVTSTEEAFVILDKGQKRRKVAHTVLNAESSRSHSVFNIRLVQAPLDETGKDVLMDRSKVTVSQLSLVDLAGSERTKRTDATGDRLKEAGQINQSLMVLRQCIDILRDNQKHTNTKPQLVPYRDSKVTHLFKNYFDGEGKVKLVVCVNPKGSEYDETLHVMRFSEAAQEVQVYRAVDRPKVSDPQLVQGRRRMAQAGIAVPVPTKKPAPVAPVPLSDIYQLLPFPSYQMDCNSDDDIIILQEYIKNRINREEQLRTSIQREYEEFRSIVIDEDKENRRLSQENKQLLQLLKERDQRIQEQSEEVDHLRTKLSSANKESSSLRQRITQYMDEKQELRDEIHHKDRKLYQADHEKEKVAEKCQRKVAQTKMECERKVDEERQRIQQEALDNLTVKERKLRLLKNIVNSSDVDSVAGDTASAVSTPASERPSRSTPRVTPASIPSYAAPTGSSNRKHIVNNAGRSRPPTRARPYLTPRAKSPPASMRPTPIRNHRRSRSAGDRWLDHRPQHTLPLDTVLQPKLGKKKKSVGKIEVKHTEKANKYILTSQDTNSHGELETQLVKGDVRTSLGGGSSVVFTEVETLKQTSPGDSSGSGFASRCTSSISIHISTPFSGKRRYVPVTRDDYDGEWTDTEERCNIAHEGHGVYKRVRQIERTAQV